MRLLEFITASIDPIALEWVAFAKTRLPAAASMDDKALRNDVVEILNDLVANMGELQTLGQQKDKSQEINGADPAGRAGITTRRHAQQRAYNGFETIQLVSEFRALRATVLRLWTASSHVVDVRDLEDVTRFNEAVDETLAASLKVFVAESDHGRHLFMGMLGHDLRGPIHTIMGCAQRGLRKRPESRLESDMILRSAAHIKMLADDLPAFTINGLNIDPPITARTMDLKTLCKDSVDEITVINPARRIELAAEGATSGEWDGRGLHQMLWNLIANALKYLLPDEPVTIGLDGTAPGAVVLSVHNYGTAIPPEVLPKLFAPLVRGSLEQVASLAGANLGLGLYIVNTIVRAHLGAISVTSSNADGTKFEISLPRRIPPASRNLTSET